MPLSSKPPCWENKHTTRVGPRPDMSDWIEQAAHEDNQALYVRKTCFDSRDWDLRIWTINAGYMPEAVYVHRYSKGARNDQKPEIIKDTGSDCFSFGYEGLNYSQEIIGFGSVTVDYDYKTSSWVGVFEDFFHRYYVGIPEAAAGGHEEAKHVAHIITICNSWGLSKLTKDPCKNAYGEIIDGHKDLHMNPLSFVKYRSLPPWFNQEGMEAKNYFIGNNRREDWCPVCKVTHSDSYDDDQEEEE